jgi:Dolichyl-phosphate-mannose-protein mannosyltransferase
VLPDTSTQPGTTGRLRSPVAALAATVLVCFALTAAISWFVETPRIFYDELIYMEAAASLADGEGLQVRGEPYRYGALYPTVAAPVVALAGDREAAHALLKVLNSLLFALTAVPAYLLARRLLEPWPSVAVAALSVVVPSSVYVTVVMTESVAYFTATWALLAIVLAVERPTAWRQVAALVAVGVAVLARAQFVALYAALLLALVSAHLLLPLRRRLGSRGGLRMLWPAAASLVLGLVLFVVGPVLRGGSPGDALGGYEHLLRGYDLATVGKWLVLHAAGFELYLAVIPVAVAPIVLSAHYARAREGSERYAAFLATFATVNAAALVSAAIAVTSQADPGFENPRLHDRYLFYVVPLWLIVLVWWVRAGAPRPRVATRIGIALAALLALLFPYWQLELQDGVKLFSAVGTALPAAIEEIAGSALAGAIVTLVAVGLLLAAVFRRPGAATKVVFGALVGVFLVNAVLVWGRAFNPLEGAVFPGSEPERRWVDERVPEGATVIMLQSECEDATLERDSYFLTEFFNDSIDDVVRLTENATGRVGADGAVVLSSGDELEARFVVAQPGVRLNGAALGQGTAAKLVLWTVSAPVRVEGVEGPPAARRGFCLELPA